MIDEARLNDYLDGELSDDEATALEAELASDAAAQTLLAELAETRAALAALPLEARAPAHLWAGIEARIHHDTSGREVDAAGLHSDAPRRDAAVIELPQRRRPLFLSRNGLLAAGLAGLMAVGAYQLGVRRGGAAPEPVSVTAAAPAASAVGLVRTVSDTRRVYDESVRELEEALAAGADVLQPETRATIERSLATIDQAIQEAEQALAADPASPVVERRLLSAWQSKLGLLQQAVTAVQRAT
ncbi:MAG: hypothetical protein R3E10_15485 [Gemmatimonadota bacterium]